jgi:hypothetical protein
MGCYVPDSPSESRRPAGRGCPKDLFTLGGNCDCLGGRRSLLVSTYLQRLLLLQDTSAIVVEFVHYDCCCSFYE